jgi:hypothetical protein
MKEFWRIVVSTTLLLLIVRGVLTITRLNKLENDFEKHIACCDAEWVGKCDKEFK